MNELLEITEMLYNKYGDGGHFAVTSARKNDSGEWELLVKPVEVKKVVAEDVPFNY